MPRSDTGSETYTENMASTGGAEEDDPGVAPGDYESPIPDDLSSPFTEEVIHGS